MYENENIVDSIADFIIKAYRSETNYMVKLAVDTLTMLVNYMMEKTNLNTESIAVKNTRDFLIKLSEIMPKVFYNNLSAFMELYCSEVNIKINKIYFL